MKHPLFTISVLALMLLFPQTSRAGNPTLEAILSEIRQADAAREEAIRDMVYTAVTTVVEWEDASRESIKSETLSIRRVYAREPNQIHNEYLSMTIDGRRLSQREMERELAKQRRGGRNRGDGDFQSPFRPKEPEENLFTGTAVISRGDYRPMFVEMAPAKLPGILEEFTMSIRFAPVGEYWLPSVFNMDMRVRISFLVTLADRTLSIEDRYSDYRLNVGLDAGVFENE